MPEGSPGADDLAHIQHAAEQAVDVTRKLLTFGRADSVNTETFDLNEPVIDLTQLVGRSLGAGIQCVTHLAERDCLVHGDRSQIEQLLMNLILNARDALGRGTIVVTTRHDRQPLPPTSGTAAPVVVLTVEDDGAGMTVDECTRAFEPFFTTKHGGTGLGLATAHSIVARAAGHIAIQSEVGAGTTVTVTLPEARHNRAAGDPHSFVS